MDLEGITLNTAEKGKDHMVLLKHRNLKKSTNEPIYKTEIESQM